MLPEPARRLIAPSYVVLAALSCVPIAEAFVTAWPFHLAQVEWRLGFTALAANGAGTTLLGALLILIVAAVARHQGVVRTGAAVAAIATLILLAAAGVFVLDSTQMWQRVRPDVAARYKLASALALAKLLISAGGFAFLAIRARKSARDLRRTERSPTASLAPHAEVLMPTAGRSR